MHQPGPWKAIPEDADSQRVALAAPLMYEALHELHDLILEVSKPGVWCPPLGKAAEALRAADGIPRPRK